MSSGTGCPVSRTTLLACVLAGLAGPVLVALVTGEYGVNLSPDTLTYLGGADVLAADGLRGLLTFPSALHPPGLSVALAPAAALGVSVEAARWLGVGLVAASAIGVGVYLAHRVRPVLAVAAAALVGLGYPMVHVASWLTSEPLYIALTLVHLALLAGLAGVVGARRPATVAAGAGLVAALAVLVRYSGVTILPFGVLAVLLLAPRGRRLAAGSAYVAPVALLVGGWLLRNVLLTGYPTGDRASNELAVTEVLADAVETLTDWFVPSRGPEALRTAVLVVVAAAAVAATVTALRQHRHDGPAERRPVLVALLAGHLLLGAVGLTVLVSATNTDPVGDRLLAPLWAPLVALLIVVADLTLDRAGGLDRARPRGRVVTGAVVLVPLLAVVLTAGRAVEAAAGGEWTGAGFNGPRWQSDAVRTLVAAAPPGTAMVGNEPYGLTVAAGREALESPRFTAYASTEASEDSVAGLVATVAVAPTYLLWTRVDDGAVEDHVAPPELARHVTLVPVASSPAGEAYRVLPRPLGR